MGILNSTNGSSRSAGNTEPFSPLLDRVRSIIREEVQAAQLAPEEIRDIVREELEGNGLGQPLDRKEAAEALNISVRKLDQLVSAGKLRPIRIGTKPLFLKEHLDAFLRRCAGGSGR